MEKYSFEEFEKEEILAGKKSTAKFIRLNFNGKPIGQIKYEMVGKNLKVWNRVTFGTPDERRKANTQFSSETFNTDNRTIDDELVIQAIAKEKPIGITTPHKTESAKRTKTRLHEKYGIRIGYLEAHKVPKKVNPLLNRRRVK